MNRIAKSTGRLALKLLISSVLGAAIMAVGLIWFYVGSLPELKIWHEVDLREEFTRYSRVESFADYLALEERLFAELERRVLDEVDEGDRTSLNRYHRGSLADPARWPRDWNRTFELPVAEPKAGVVLLHGLSDSPYSLRHFGSLFHEQGAWVVGLRVPGHGTAPTGLTRVRWEDMAAAVRIAVAHTRDQVGSRPIYLVGYSNGAALAVEYAFSSLVEPGLPRVEGLVLLSPMIGVGRSAAFAIWQERLGRVFGIDELQYTGIMPEYDPFKYGSFAVNAGNQSYRLTHEIRERVARQDMSSFPRVLAFQSAVDSTVSTSDVVTVLMKHLPENGSELVLLDIYRRREVERLMRDDPRDALVALLRGQDLSFTITALTTAGGEGQEVVIRRRRPGEQAPTTTRTDLRWPPDMFSLGHIALPFPPGDPLYGDGRVPSPGIALGNLAWRGERGILEITPADMLRVRWNPFFSYLEARTREFVRLP